MKFFTSITTLLALLVFCQINIYGQKIIKGKIIDEISRQPLEFVTISEPNKPVKVLSDKYGEFAVVTNTDSMQLIISIVGYNSKIIYALANQTNLISLNADLINLKEITLQANTSSKFSSIAKVDLNLKPVRNTQELLRVVPGLFIAQHAGGGKAEQIFLRGFDCDHGTDIQVSVDGMPVNMVSHAHGQGYADAHFIIPETINSIDFGAGPYNAQHGNLNTAGYVSFSTAAKISKSIVQMEAGRFNTYRTLAMVDLLKKNKDKQSAYFAGEYNYTNGPTIAEQNFKRLNLFAKYNLTISNRTSLTATASYFNSNWNASGQVPTRAVESGMIDRFGSIDPTEGGNTDRVNINLIVVHNFKKDSKWENQLFYSRYKFNLFSNFTFYLNDPLNGDEINQAENRNILGYNSSLNKKYYFKNWALHSLYGAGLRQDEINDSKLTHVVKRQFSDYVKSGDINETNFYAYTQQQANIGKWLLDAGIRFDHLHFKYLDKLSTTQLKGQGKSIISPKINIQYTFNPTLQFFVKAGKGFHSNDTRVVVANSGKEILPAAYGTDIGMIIKPIKNLYISIAAWTLYLDQEFVYVGDDGNIEPSGKTKREGIDLLARYQFNQKLFANLNINFTKPRARGEIKGQNYIPLAPTATSTGGIFYKARKGFNGSLTYRYIADRPANEDNSIVAKGYFLLDGSINYTQKKYEIGLALENILNVKWNEAQFATESRLMKEPAAITELNFTPGSPFFARLKLSLFF